MKKSTIGICGSGFCARFIGNFPFFHEIRIPICIGDGLLYTNASVPDIKNSNDSPFIWFCIADRCELWKFTIMPVYKIPAIEGLSVYSV